MYYIVVLLASLGLSHGNKHKPDGAVLNISRRRPEGIAILRQNVYNIDTLVYTAVDGYISDVVDDRGLIWRDESRNLKFSKVVKFRKETKLLHVQSITVDNTSIVKYFYRTGRVWNEINSGRFYDEFDVLKSLYNYINDFTIYLRRNNDKKKARINKTDDSRFAAYAPNYGYRANKVCYRNLGGMCFKSLWCSESFDEHCLFVSVHSRDKPRLAYLIISDRGKIGEKFYYKPGYFKSWRLVSEDEYLERLKERHIDLDTINAVELDLNGVDASKFYVSETELNGSVRSAFPRPGFRLTRVSFGDKLVWERRSDEHYCFGATAYAENGSARLCYLLVSEGRERSIDYYHFEDGAWASVDKAAFYRALGKRDHPRYTHRSAGLDAEGNRRIETSHFRNRRGMLIRTYRALVPGHRGVVLFLHGLRLHFLSTALKHNFDWSFRNFGFASHPFLVCPDPDFFFDFGGRNFERYRHVFEHNFYDPVLPLARTPMFEYQGGLLAALNDMGFSVYGMDIQAHGFSESLDLHRCHAGAFSDYVDDVLQFIFIVRRGKFLDTRQAWDERVFAATPEFPDPLILFGYSFGVTLFFSALEEHARRYGSSARLADFVVSLSGMLDISPNMTRVQLFFAYIILAIFILESRYPNPYEQISDFGESFEASRSTTDSRAYILRYTWRTLRHLFVSCNRIASRIKHFPKDIPVLFIHFIDDYRCSVKGVRNLVRKMKGCILESNELPGNFHHTYKTESLDDVLRIFENWLPKFAK